MNYFKMNIDVPSDCPEKEAFLDDEDLLRGRGYYPSIEECISNFRSGNCDGSCEKEELVANTLELFSKIALEHGFESFEKKIVDNVDGEQITTSRSIIGFYTDENKCSAFIDKNVNLGLLPIELTGKISSLKKINSLYEGENHAFFKVDGTPYSINIRFLRVINEIISEIAFYHYFEIKEYLATTDGSLMGIRMSDKSLFIIAGKVGYQDYLEEERIILSERINSAQPFFNFEPHKKIDWIKLKEPKGHFFEMLCEVILSRQEGVTDIQPIGKTTASDRGRDFVVCEKSMNINGEATMTKWLVQCKYSEKSISTKTVPDWTNRVLEHDLDGFWLMTNNDITPDLFDQLNDTSKNRKVVILTRIWQRNKFDALFNTYPELFTSDEFDNQQ